MNVKPIYSIHNTSLITSNRQKDKTSFKGNLVNTPELKEFLSQMKKEDPNEFKTFLQRYKLMENVNDGKNYILTTTEDITKEKGRIVEKLYSVCIKDNDSNKIISKATTLVCRTDVALPARGYDEYEQTKTIIDKLLNSYLPPVEGSLSVNKFLKSLPQPVSHK